MSMIAVIAEIDDATHIAVGTVSEPQSAALEARLTEAGYGTSRTDDRSTVLMVTAADWQARGDHREGPQADLSIGDASADSAESVTQTAASVEPPHTPEGILVAVRAALDQASVRRETEHQIHRMLAVQQFLVGLSNQTGLTPDQFSTEVVSGLVQVGGYHAAAPSPTEKAALAVAARKCSASVSAPSRPVSGAITANSSPA